MLLPSGWSTPANLITLGRHAMRYGVFKNIVAQASYSLPAGNGHHAYKWRDTDPGSRWALPELRSPPPDRWRPRC